MKKLIRRWLGIQECKCVSADKSIKEGCTHYVYGNWVPPGRGGYWPNFKIKSKYTQYRTDIEQCNILDQSNLEYKIKLEGSHTLWIEKRYLHKIRHNLEINQELDQLKEVK